MTLYSPELGDALTARAGETLGGMVTGLYAVVQWIDEDGDQRIAIACSPDQTMIVTQGLLVVANNVADTELTTFVLDSTGNGE